MPTLFSIPWQIISQSGTLLKWVKKPSQQKVLHSLSLKSLFLLSQSSNFNPSRTNSNVSSSMSLPWFLPPDTLFFYNLLLILEIYNIYVSFLFPILNLRMLKLKIHFMSFETSAASKLVLWIYYITCKCLLEA